MTADEKRNIRRALDIDLFMVGVAETDVGHYLVTLTCPDCLRNLGPLEDAGRARGKIRGWRSVATIEDLASAAAKHRCKPA